MARSRSRMAWIASLTRAGAVPPATSCRSSTAAVCMRARSTPGATWMPQRFQSSSPRRSSSQSFLDRETHRAGDELVRAPEGNALFGHARRHRERVHAARAGGGAHARRVELERARTRPSARRPPTSCGPPRRTAGAVSPAGPCCTRAAAPSRTMSKATASPDHPPALPAHQLQRVGVLLLRHGARPVVNASASSHAAELLAREQNPDPPPSGSCAPRAARAACRNSSAKSRSLVASMLLAVGRSKPRSRAIASRSRAATLPATAPDAERHTFSRRRQSCQALRCRASNISKYASSAVRDQHRLGALQVRVRRHGGFPAAPRRGPRAP